MYRLIVFIFLSILLLHCQSKPAKKQRVRRQGFHYNLGSNQTNIDEAKDLLIRFTRDAVETKSINKNLSVAANSTPNSSGSLLSWTGKKPAVPATEFPVIYHSVLIKDNSPPGSEDIGNNDTDEANKVSTGPKEQGPKFDEKAIQRAFMVFGGLCTIILIYFGIKFIFVKKRKAVRRYGRVESSEMDLLENVEEDEEEEDDDTLFDINAHRRTQFT